MFLYPIDGWTAGNAFRNATREDAYRYGAMVAARYAGFPNIVWMTGGDHFPSDLPGRHDSPPVYDELFEEVLSGIRSTGDTRPFSIQLGYPASISTDSPQWAPRVAFNFVYTYLPTYRAVLDAYRRNRLRRCCRRRTTRVRTTCPARRSRGTRCCAGRWRGR
ncbi:hypothetical protein BJF90_28465 [Pseudonocardia sp. CNS-004]|nr:hypothetical protein BJF90_28465 [Pseudonocardia sp. CNS-004]